MKKLIRISCAIFGILAVASCSSNVYLAGRQTSKVLIDGNPNEWSLPLRYSDSESGLQYTVTNDETTIYICFRANEQALQMRILGSGMEINLYPPGKNKETALVRFPLPARHERNEAAGNLKPDRAEGRNTAKSSLAEQFKLEHQQLILSGFQPGYNGNFLAAESNAIKAAINWDMINSMTYELAIPIKSLLSNNLSILKDNPVIGFKLDISANADQGIGPKGGGMQGGPPDGGGRQSSGGSQGGGPGSGMGGGSGGGMGKGAHPPVGQASNESGSATSIKFKFKLNGLVSE